MYTLQTMLQTSQAAIAPETESIWRAISLDDLDVYHHLVSLLRAYRRHSDRATPRNPRFDRAARPPLRPEKACIPPTLHGLT